MISTFPSFTKLSLDHRAEVETITAAFEPYADFSFVNLYAWGTERASEAAILRGNLVVRLPDYIKGDATMYSLLGNNEIERSVAEVLCVASRLELVPEPVALLLPDTGPYRINDDRDNSDYIYDVQNLATLRGGELKKKRNKVHRFLHDLGGAITTQVTSEIGEPLARELLAVFTEWARDSKNKKETSMEFLAITRMLQDVQALKLLFTIVRIDGRICAFSIHEITYDNNAICHFEKALPIHDSLYAFIIYFTANELAARGVKVVNWQQDLGIPGLRQAKMCYQPKGFLKKYTVSLA